jgi:hypothetical protein
MDWKITDAKMRKALLEFLTRPIYNQPTKLKMNGLNMKKTSIIIAYALMTFALLLPGCAGQKQCQPVEQICLSGINKQQAMQAAEDCLSNMHFTIEKADVEQGLIRTRPLTGGQFSEFWRSDNVGSFNTAEANIQTIRRTAELKISEQTGQLCINCNVSVQRLNMPERKTASGSQAYRMFTKSRESMQRLELDASQKKTASWVDLGKDTQLETEILKRLEQQIKKLQKEKLL